MTRSARRRQEEHPNHERWLVSYADFVTLLFAFFVVMYAISQVNEGKYQQLSNSLIQAFQSLADASYLHQPSRSTGAKGLSETSRGVGTKLLLSGNAKRDVKRRAMQVLAHDLVKLLGPLVKQGHVKILGTGRGIMVEINASILFDTGQAVLNPEALKLLSALATRLKTTQDNFIQVEGFTDNLPIQTRQYPSNWELSSARASSVVRVFSDSGVAPVRLAAVGFSEYQPVAPNDTPVGRAQNRRVRVVILE